MADFDIVHLKQGGIDMRHLVLAIVMAVGVSLIGIAGASAAPAANGQAILKAADQVSSITQVSGGCGRGWHRGRHGHCRRN